MSEKSTKIVNSSKEIEIQNKIKKKRESQYKCQACGKRQKVYRMFEVDGTNLVEVLVCLNCGSGRPAIQ